MLYQLSYLGKSLKPSANRATCIHFAIQPLPALLERVMGIEPTQSAWKAEVLPLNYTRITRTPDPAAQLAKARPPQSPTAALPRERKARAPRSIASDLRRFAPASNRFFGSHPHRTRRWEDFQQLAGGGRITPRLRRCAPASNLFSVRALPQT